MTRHVVGFAGLPGSGKNSASDMLNGPGRIVYQTSFAAELKRIAAYMFGIELKYFEDRTLKEASLPEWGGITPRYILRKLGTEAARGIHADVWVRLWARQLAGIPVQVVQGREPVTVIVTVTDVRFPNELAAIRNRGGRVYWIDRPGLVPSEHDSDNSVTAEMCDRVIYNHTTLYDFGEAVRAVVLADIDNGA